MFEKNIFDVIYFEDFFEFSRVPFKLKPRQSGEKSTQKSGEKNKTPKLFKTKSKFEHLIIEIEFQWIFNSQKIGF